MGTPGQNDLTSAEDVGPGEAKRCRVSDINRKLLLEAIKRAGAKMMEAGGKPCPGTSQTTRPPTYPYKYFVSPLEEENTQLKQRIQELEAEVANKHEMEEQFRLENEDMRSLHHEKEILQGQVSQLLVLLDQAVQLMPVSPPHGSSEQGDETSAPSPTTIVAPAEPFQQLLEAENTPSATATSPDQSLQSGADTPTTSSSTTVSLETMKREQEEHTTSSTITLETMKQEPTGPPPPSPELIAFASQLGLQPIVSQQPGVSISPQARVPQPSNFNRIKGNEDLVLLHSVDKTKEKDCICGKTFANLITLAGHIQYHNEEWKFICKRCNERFYSITPLRKHMSQVHGERMSERLSGCHSCGGLFEGRVALFQHKRSDECRAKAQKRKK